MNVRLVAPIDNNPLPHSKACKYTSSGIPLTASRARSPERCTTLKLVPLLSTSITAEPLVSNERVVMSEPGAATQAGPQLEYVASFPSIVEAATAMTPLQFAGK